MKSEIPLASFNLNLHTGQSARKQQQIAIPWIVLPSLRCQGSLFSNNFYVCVLMFGIGLSNILINMLAYWYEGWKMDGRLVGKTCTRLVGYGFLGLNWFLLFPNYVIKKRFLRKFTFRIGSNQATPGKVAGRPWNHVMVVVKNTCYACIRMSSMNCCDLSRFIFFFGQGYNCFVGCWKDTEGILKRY